MSQIIKFRKPSNFQNSTVVKLKISKISHSSNNHTSILSVLAIFRDLLIFQLLKYQECPFPKNFQKINNFLKLLNLENHQTFKIRPY